MLSSSKSPSNSPLPALWCVVPAAGIGQRMQSDCPKQYLPLLGTTLLEQTLLTLLSFEPLVGIVVVVHKEDVYWNDVSVSQHPKIHKVIGGDERSDSVLSGLKYLATYASEQDWVLVHDAARPCVHPDSLQVLVNALISDPVGGVLGVPSNDTLKKVTPDQVVETTINRDEIWQAQTPQMFRYLLLKEALQYAIECSQPITDEASAMELSGHLFTMVKGRYDNIKVTHPDDLWLAEAILTRHKTP